MTSSNADVASDAAQVIKNLELENAQLRAQLEHLRIGTTFHNPSDAAACPVGPRDWDGLNHGLTKDQIGRYSRQIILPSFGVQAQARVCSGSVLVIGAGGLGSPALLYLAAAGVGRIGIVDRDSVELSNIHRQIIHTEASVGVHKALSAARACQAINSSIVIETHLDGFSPENAVDLVSQYDVVLDASDNAPTRYLISDACAVTGRPLVSGAAIGTDGQLTVYCHGDDGPCYRCLFPTAPLPQSCARCVDAGVLGVVPGVIGTLQAVETVKILAGLGEPMSRKLLIMDSLYCRYHAVKLRAKSPACIACGDQPTITKDNLASYDYESFTGQRPNDGAPAPISLLDQSQRITPKELQSKLLQSSSSSSGQQQQHVLIDVRPLEQYNICHLPDAIHAPYAKFDNHIDTICAKLEETQAVELIVVCRRGNDSQRAVDRLMNEEYSSRLSKINLVDVIGGMEGWAKDVDPEFPVY